MEEEKEQEQQPEAPSEGGDLNVAGDLDVSVSEEIKSDEKIS